MRPERGFALVAALFLMVIVALVVATMSRLAINQNAAGDLALQQARADQAARAGLEWGINRVRSSGACASGSLSMAGGNLAEFTVGLSCSQRSYTGETGAALSLFTLVATADNGTPDSRTDYAWRRLTATVGK
jgi:MSHA biogenesis protein MshP